MHKGSTRVHGAIYLCSKPHILHIDQDMHRFELLSWWACHTSCQTCRVSPWEEIENPEALELTYESMPSLSCFFNPKKNFNFPLSWLWFLIMKASWSWFHHYLVWICWSQIILTLILGLESWLHRWSFSSSWTSQSMCLINFEFQWLVLVVITSMHSQRQE